MSVISFALLATASAGESSVSLPSESSIRQWVKELDADRFETRQRAQDELVKAGSSAANPETVIAPLAEAASQGNLEVSMRVLNVLKDLLDAPTVATRAAATEALRRLSTSENKAIAAKAASFIQGPNASRSAPAAPPFGGRGGFPMGGVIIGGGKLQINVGEMNGQVIEFQAFGGKGQRNIHTRDNGRGVDIKDDTEGGITMTITERVDGKDESRTIEAKDAAELKVKDPQAYELYEKHTAGKQMGAMNNGQFVLGAGGLFIQGGAPEAGDVAAATQTLTALQTELQSAQHTVQRLRAKAATGKVASKDLKPYLEQVEGLRKKLNELESQSR
jgi:hypothetical protein